MHQSIRSRVEERIWHNAGQERGAGGGITDLWFLAEIEAWERNGSMILTTSFNTAGEILKGLI